jgi:malate dehydrogenase (oxaloacetate-decarboxylating)(NADP+)
MPFRGAARLDNSFITEYLQLNKQLIHMQNPISFDKLPRGMALLNNPTLNKGTAFTGEERDKLGLRGLLPPQIQTQDDQVLRALGNLRIKESPLEKYIFLTSLQDRNETLFYRVLADNIEEVMPLVYTPTVGMACQRYAKIFRRSRGLYISIEDRGRVAEILRNWPQQNIRVIVVTDGERILGLGDLGTNGMGIPIGKLSLYTACAGIHPSVCLPVTIDVGTDNEELIPNPLYLGLRRRRVRGEEYDALIEEFISASREIFPRALVQFEDFANHNAFRLLKRYRNQICSFNDDIQGTASVTLAGILSALRLTGGRLHDQRLLFFGAGEAGTGIGELITAALVQGGLPEAEARRCCWYVDSKGLVVAGRDKLESHKLPFAHEAVAETDPLKIIATLKPTALIGVSGKSGTFSEAMVRAMAALNERPIVFALSNPTSQAECTAEQAYHWSDGRAIFASGSPFDPVTLNGSTHVPGQGNNAYIFPGIGLGASVVASRLITDDMFLAAAHTLAGLTTEADLAQGRVFPPLSQIRKVSLAIAVAVARVACERGLAAERPQGDLEECIRSMVYEPVYQNFCS